MSAVIERQQTLPGVPQAPANMLEMIARAAADPNIDVSKMERLMEMYERIQSKNAEAAFNAAMSAAQAQMGRISADATNPQTRSKYASYAKLDATLRPIYTEHGFALSFDEGKSDKPEYVLVLCRVSHKDGHSRLYQKEMPADGKGAKGGDVMTKTHAAGAAMTYGMRYLLKGIFNVAIGENDTDGNPPGAAPRVSEEQIANIKALMTEVNANRAQFLKLWKINDLSEILACNYDTVMQLLQAKRR